MVPSVMDSPIWGMTTSVGMNFFLPQIQIRAVKTNWFQLDAPWNVPFGLYGGRAIADLGSAVSERLRVYWRLDTSRQQLIDGFAPQHLALEDASEVACCRVKGLFHRWLAVRVGFELQAGDLAINNSAGNDPFKVAEVCRYVKREAVRGDALRDLNPDRRDFS